MLIFMKMILKPLLMLDFLFGIINLNNVKHLKKSKKELMPVAWHSTRWWDWCMSEDDKMKQKQFLLMKINIKFLVLFQLK